jgi:hypothetical protein
VTRQRRRSRRCRERTMSLPKSGAVRPGDDLRPGVMELDRDTLLRRSVCAAGRPARPQVTRCMGLSGSDREYPVLTGRSGMQRARRCPVTARTVQGMAPYPGQARCLALGFWPECFRRLDVKGGRRPFPEAMPRR